MVKFNLLNSLFLFINIIIGIFMTSYSQAVNADNFNFPQFSKVLPQDLLKDFEKQILAYKQTIDTIVKQSNLDWEHIVQPLEDQEANLEKVINKISLLHSVKDNEDLRQVFTQVLNKLTLFNADFLQNQELYQKILQLSKAQTFNRFNIAQKKIIDNFLLSFKLAGINLTKEQQSKYKEITAKLSELSDQFSKNVLDATQSWKHYISAEEKEKLNGLPEHFLITAKQKAIKDHKPEGWVISLDTPSVDAILRYAINPELREIVYKAHITKASDQFNKEFLQFDNTQIMQAIIKLRYELSTLLGFKNYSEYSLVRKVAKTTTEVLNFLDELAVKSVPIAKQEFSRLQEFAKSKGKFNALQPWDINYYAELYKQHLYTLNDEELRNYFSLDKVLSGMFNLANELYGIKVTEINEFDSWDPMVKLYKVTDNNDKLYGFFYMDLYVRDHKQGGACMANCSSRHKYHDATLQHPIAFLITNFSHPIDGGSLLYHHDVETLLHEFGHVLHHILTQVDYASVSGCSGVSWDAVELPSQFMEKWFYDWNFLNSIAIHNKTKQPLSKEQFSDLIKIKNYNAGLSMVRQLEFAIFDFTLHMWAPTENNLSPDVQKYLDLARSKVTVVPVAKFNRFQHGFSHIFSGGYSAGYYSYNWADVLAADAYMAFHDLSQIKNPNLKSSLGKKFLENILQMGGSRDAMDLYIAFRDHKPKIDSLLEYKGLINKK